jgi:hypothetical protein
MFKMSARKLQEIFAGKITARKYFVAYDTPRGKMEIRSSVRLNGVDDGRNKSCEESRYRRRVTRNSLPGPRFRDQ